MGNRDIDRKIKICYIAGREPEYVRTRTLLKALQRAGFEVRSCLPPNKKFIHYPKLLLQFLIKKKGCDVVLVGFYGALLMLFVRLFTRKPILFDIHSGTHETMIDWEKARPNGLRSGLYFWTDHFTMNMATRNIIESQDHIQVWSSRYRVPAEKFDQVFLATDDEVVYEKPVQKKSGDPFLVHFHGEYAPFHGVDVILKAAHLLRNEPVAFQIIGWGTTYNRDMALSESLNLQNCRFIRWVPYEELADYMSRADVCLGFFGDRQRAREVFTNKVVEAIAVKRPLVTMQSKAVAELLTDGESVLFTEPGNPESLAEVILGLRDNPELRRQLVKNASAQFQKHCTLDAFARRMGEIVCTVLK